MNFEHTTDGWNHLLHSRRDTCGAHLSSIRIYQVGQFGVQVRQNRNVRSTRLGQSMQR